MNKHFGPKASIILKSFIVASAFAMPMAHAATISKTEYEATTTRIAADYKADEKACAALAGNAKDVCIEQAKAKQKVALAELEYRYSGKPDDQTKVRVAKAESAYAVAKEKCDDKAGNAKDVCLKQAEAAQTGALADAKISGAGMDAAKQRRDADYKVALERCDAMSGDAKTSCIASAKADFAPTATKAESDAAAEARISADYKADAAPCESLAGNAKDVCIEEAKGKEKVARAELVYQSSGKPSDQNKVLVAKSESAYAIAKEKCDDKAGNAKDVCVKQAEAAKTKALADAQVAEVKTDAAQSKRDADYKVAAEECDAMSGTTKDSCIATAKSNYSQN